MLNFKIYFFSYFYEFPSKFEFQTFKKYSIRRFSIFILIIVRKTYGGLFINLRFQTPKKKFFIILRNVNSFQMSTNNSKKIRKCYRA